MNVGQAGGRRREDDAMQTRKGQQVTRGWNRGGDEQAGNEREREREREREGGRRDRRRQRAGRRTGFLARDRNGPIGNTTDNESTGRPLYDLSALT